MRRSGTGARWATLALAAVLCAGAASAQTPQQDRQRCSDGSNLDVQIGACTAAIRAGGVTDAALSALLTNRCRAYYLKREYDTAIPDCDHAIRLSPRADTYTHRANCHSAKGDTARAIADLDQAIRLNPNYDYAIFNRGREYLEMRQYERALQDFNRAIQIDASQADAFELRGLVHLKANRLDAAITDFTAALRIDPRSALSFYGRGLARQRKGDAAGATTDMAAGTAIRPTIANTFAKHDLR